MKPLWPSWPSLRHRLLSAEHLFLFLDYDGTLAPLAAHPARARLPIYVGDDQTDEDAFEVLGNRGIIAVQPAWRRSRAQYRVRSPRDVQRLLEQVVSGWAAAPR